MSDSENRACWHYLKCVRLHLIELLLILSVNLLIACSTSTMSSSKSSTVRLNEADDGSSIELRQGDRLEVILPANPTTGFQWEIKAVNTDILHPIGEPTFKPSSTAVGSAGNVTLSFQATSSGQTKLELIHHRPFEKNVPPIQSFEVTVSVK